MKISRTILNKLNFDKIFLALNFTKTYQNTLKIMLIILFHDDILETCPYKIFSNMEVRSCVFKMRVTYWPALQNT